MGQLIVRPATEADLAAIAAIYNDAIRTTTATFDTEEKTLEDRRQWLASHDAKHPVIVAQMGDEVAGWGCLSAWSDRCAYAGTCENSVYVATSARGKGVGKALLAELVNLARQAGMHTMIARVAAGNPASERLHKGAGFVRIGVMREVGRKFGRLLDVTMYQLML
ncbi:MAG: N-acetyltransferase [Planctomycetes bacterium]|nr:N-acetyltransferase [Planctomycetota bacterium]